MTEQRSHAGNNEARFRKLIELGIALSAERNHPRLMERILLGAKELAAADGGTLYVIDGDRLGFQILRNDTLGIAEGGTTGRPVRLPPLPLVLEDGSPNLRNVAALVANTGRTINIADAYHAPAEFDFSGVKHFDAVTGYRSRSFLTVPLKDNTGRISGVLQLINAAGRTGFPGDLVPVIEALAGQAAVALDNFHLLKAQKDLLQSFIKVLAAAIDAKSPYTGSHCQRVPVLTEMLTQAACDQQAGPFADFALDEEGWYELHVAAWLHDCGKVTTPEHIIDKATKLEAIYDRIHAVAARFAALRQQAQAEYWQALAEGGDAAALRPELARRLAELDGDRRFLETVNVGGEAMAPDALERLRRIAARRWTDADGIELPLLTEDELRNLSVVRGTLTPEERQIVNDHIVLTIKMLEQLPFPRTMANVVEYAGGHHEKMDGTGYPSGKTREQLSVPARIMAIADIFEALTAVDRPYKTGKTLSETVRIMAGMKAANHIDPDLFDLFLNSGVYQRYAERYLQPDQIDAVDVGEFMGK